MSFSHTSYGKWILTGEHSVIRGGRALVFPLTDKKMNFSWEENGQELEVRFDGEQSTELKVIFFSLLEEALRKLNLSRGKLTGILSIHSDLPLGAGLGASGAACVAVTKWLGHLGYVPDGETFEFARQLENLFHGESSGVDIAVSIAGKPIIFQKGVGFEVFQPAWQPNWYLSYSGERGSTMDCVRKVQKLHAEGPSLGEEIDQEMKKSVDEAIQALMASEKEGFHLLVKAVTRAEACFKAWGLTEGALDRKIAKLKDLGAAAVKPTGSGGGGYILHIWPKNAVPGLNQNLIRC